MFSLSLTEVTLDSGDPDDVPGVELLHNVVSITAHKHYA